MKFLLLFIWFFISLPFGCSQPGRSNQPDKIRQLYSAFSDADNKGDMNQLKQLLPEIQDSLRAKNISSLKNKGLLFSIEGGILLETGDYEASLLPLAKADSLCTLAFGFTSPEGLQAKRFLSWAYGYNGHLELERKLSFDLLNIYFTNKQKNILEIADLYHTIGSNYGNEGNRPDEQRLYKEGIHLMETFNPQSPEQKDGKNYALGLIYNSLSLSQYASNNYEAALQNAWKSLYYRNQMMAGSPQLSTNWMVIGRSLYQTEGNADSALFYIDKAISILEKKDKEGNSLKGSKYWATYKGYKTDILRRAGRTGETIGETQSIIAVLQKNKEPGTVTGLIPGYCSLSAAYLQKGNATEALAAMQSLKKKLDNDPTLLKLSRIKMNAQYAVALSEAKKEVSTAAVFSDVINQTGLSLSQLEQPSFSIPVTSAFEFLTVYVQAADAMSKQALFIHNTLLLQQSINIYRNVIAALQAREAWYFEAGVEENIGSEDLKVYEKLLSVLYDAKGLISEPQRLQYAFTAIESSKANLLQSSLSEEKYFSTVLSAAENTKRIDLKTALYATLKKGNETADAGSGSEIKKAKENYVTYIQSLKKKYQARNDNTQLTIAEKDPLLLHHKGVIINYFLGSQNLYSFVHQDGKISFTRKNLFPDLDKAISFVRHRHDQANDSVFTISQALYKWLLGDIALHDELIIIPHKQLSLISFDMLSINKQSAQTQYLIDKCTVRYSYSAGLLTLAGANSKSKHATHFFGGFAASQFDTSGSYQFIAMNTTNEETRNNTAALAGTEKEVKAIADVMRGDAYLHANPNDFLQHAAGYRILHIATHAFADADNQHQCHFLFENDSSNNKLISGDEISVLPIQADMAVLSACNTGTGKINNNEGMISLGRSFFIAGCPSVVMSLWSVNDESTSEIMTLFYKHLQKGERKDEALRNAKLDYRERQTNPQKKDPYYWAGFVVVGNNSPLKNDTFLSSTQWILIAAITATLIAVLVFYFRKRSSSSFT